MEEAYEEFKTIDGFPDYMVSDTGLVWNNKVNI